MPRSIIYDILPPWSSRIRPYPPGKPVEEVERELGRTAIKLASNENPLGTSPNALEAIQRHAQQVHLFPDGSGYYLRRKLAEIHQLKMDQIILGAGSTELMELAAKTFLSSADEAVTSEAAFYMYRLAIESMGAGVVTTPLRESTFDLVGMARAITPKTKLAYLGNPNNPTGTMFTAEALNRFLDAIPPQVLVVLDEAYHEYVQRPDYPRAVDWVRAGRNILVLRTFSKVLGLAGLGALDDHEHVARSVEMNATEMKFLTQELTLMGVRYTPSVGNFLLIDTGRDCEEDFIRLLHQGIIVRPMKLYGFPTSLRVTVGVHEENLKFLEALQRVATPSLKAVK